MIVTITQYANLAVDKAGTQLPIGGNALDSIKATAVGALTPLNGDARFVRICSDTKVEVVIGGLSHYVAADQPEYHSVGGGQSVTLVAVV